MLQFTWSSSWYIYLAAVNIGHFFAVAFSIVSFQEDLLIGSYINCPDNFKDYWLLNESSFVTAFQRAKEIYDASVVKLVATHIREMVKVDVDE